MHLLWAALLLFELFAGASASGGSDAFSWQNNEDACSSQHSGTNPLASAVAGSPDRPNPSRVVTESPGTRQGSVRFSIGDGYYFLNQRSANGRVYLRCCAYYSTPRCPARATMNLDHGNFAMCPNSGDHNHGPDLVHGRVVVFRQALQEACRARPNVRVELLYHEVSRSFDREVTSRLTLASARPSMVRSQGDHRPRLPQTFPELCAILQNDEALRRTLDLQDDLFRGMVGEEGHRSLVFMSQRMSQSVHQLMYVFGDGTYSARPNTPNSAQLYILLTTRDHHALPVCTALMESQSEQAYTALFAAVRQWAPTFQPQYIMCDFETAQMNAFRVEFPRARLCGCLWHYTRAVARNIIRLGLNDQLQRNENCHRVARLCLAIPLAPPGRLQEALNAVVVEARRLGIADIFNHFFHYLRDTWVNGVGEALCVFGVRHRTNNVAEAYNRNLNARLVRRPNVWRFLEVIREMEDVAWRDVGRLHNGLAPSRARRTSAVLNDARVRSCSRQIMAGEMEMVHFLSSVSGHLEATFLEILRGGECDERPPSPARSAPAEAPGCVPDVNNAEPEPSLECPAQPPFSASVQEDIFEDLMEENQVPASSQRARVGRRSRAPRGRRRSAVATRVSTVRSAVDVPAPATPSAQLLVASPSPTEAATNITMHSPGMTIDVPPPAAPLSQLLVASPSSTAAATSTAMRPPSVTLPATRPGTPALPVNDGTGFSDAEELPDDLSPVIRQWSECIICYSRVGRYVLRDCGAFPVCGTCIHQWYIRRGQRQCIYCRGNHSNWLRLVIESQ